MWRRVRGRGEVFGLSIRMHVVDMGGGGVRVGCGRGGMCSGEAVRYCCLLMKHWHPTAGEGGGVVALNLWRHVGGGVRGHMR